MADPTKTARVQHDFSGRDGEIDIIAGEIITNVVEVDSDWWQGMNCRGQRGFFPANHVRLCDELEAEEVEEGPGHGLDEGDEEGRELQLVVRRRVGGGGRRGQLVPYQRNGGAADGEEAPIVPYRNHANNETGRQIDVMQRTLDAAGIGRYDAPAQGGQTSVQINNINFGQGNTFNVSDNHNQAPNLGQPQSQEGRSSSWGWLHLSRLLARYLGLERFLVMYPVRAWIASVLLWILIVYLGVRVVQAVIEQLIGEAAKGITVGVSGVMTVVTSPFSALKTKLQAGVSRTLWWNSNSTATVNISSHSTTNTTSSAWSELPTEFVVPFDTDLEEDIKTDNPTDHGFMLDALRDLDATGSGLVLVPDMEDFVQKISRSHNRTASAADQALKDLIQFHIELGQQVEQISHELKHLYDRVQRRPVVALPLYAPAMGWCERCKELFKARDHPGPRIVAMRERLARMEDLLSREDKNRDDVLRYIMPIKNFRNLHVLIDAQAVQAAEELFGKLFKIVEHPQKESVRKEKKVRKQMKQAAHNMTDDELAEYKEWTLLQYEAKAKMISLHATELGDWAAKMLMAIKQEKKWIKDRKEDVGLWIKTITKMGRHGEPVVDDVEARSVDLDLLCWCKEWNKMMKTRYTGL